MAPQDISMKGEDHFALVEMMVDDAKEAERESQFHELYTELFYHQCRSFQKKGVYLSVAPQQEVGYQTFDTGDVEESQRVTRSAIKNDNRFEFIAQYTTSEESLAVFTEEGPSFSVEDEESNRQGRKGQGQDSTTKGTKPKRKRNQYKIWTPPTTWIRPDLLVYARIKTITGTVNKKVLFILEMKMDQNAFDLERDQANRERLTASLSKVVAQVLAQAQFLFAEHRDQDSIHAMIAVGFFFVDFTIERSRLPDLKEKEGCLYNSKKGKATRDSATILQMAGVSKDAFCILSKNREDLSLEFFSAWKRAREHFEELRDH
ncbi:hypothetical protein SCHPADRAFT_943980 [Schizopora paradoxa]|uniref:Uncharacterized protein n=1 Tax=Schizopora paradoxa TaxID=27342 RepID=A0A0H2RAY1_9AGAM|nr:hypothetical protein SCHPADRAFT_943980 [Schizopora paradoxa]